MSEQREHDDSEGQVSEAGGAMPGAETDVEGADAVPDKTSATSTGDDEPR